MLERILKPTKNLLRGPYRAARKKYLRQFYGFDRDGLLALLRRNGIQSGAALLVHSGMTEFAGFRGSVADIVRVFQTAVGPHGTLLMPTIPFTGTAVEYAQSDPVFDPRLTPSRVGLVSELFRRFPGVRRSIHPTHSIAVWSPDADRWIENHPLADTPCGRSSPFDVLCSENGYIVLAGVTTASLTFFHYVEEIIEPRLPFSPFTKERYTLRCRVGGRVIESRAIRLFNPEISRRRDLAPLVAELQKKSRWKQDRLGTLNIIVLRAKEVLETLEEMADRGLFCYKSATH
ncbi:MAG: AAC(3) family N-acetyltransferase [Acidobacteriota bacterium]|nr:AAC(3) family N-acetyltransferase [Acidobacteriota bacterium]